MHQPWNHSTLICGYFKDGRITDRSLAARLQEKMAAAYAVEQLAKQKGVPIYEPYQGANIGGFLVLSPNKDWYIHELIAEFAKSPEQKRLENSAMSRASGILEAIMTKADSVVAWMSEHWGIENLRDDVKSSAENESSVILFGQLDGKGVLLTGDAGVRALTATIAYAESLGCSLSNVLNFVQIPHHGSRNNVSSQILDKIVGLRKAADDGISTKSAFVSASKRSATHPRKVVINAFIRRGAKVSATQGTIKRYHHNMPSREGWVPVTPLGFSNQVEAW